MITEAWMPCLVNRIPSRCLWTLLSEFSAQRPASVAPMHQLVDIWGWCLVAYIVLVGPPVVGRNGGWTGDGLEKKEERRKKKEEI